MPKLYSGVTPRVEASRDLDLDFSSKYLNIDDYKTKSPVAEEGLQMPALSNKLDPYFFGSKKFETLSSFNKSVRQIFKSNVAPASVTQNYIIPFNYVPVAGTASAFNYIQGIGSGNKEGEFTLVGTSGANVLAKGTFGTIFQGKLEYPSTSTASGGVGTWTTMVVPKSFNSLGTSIYGVHNRGHEIYTLSGTYVSADRTVTVASGPLEGQIYNQTLGWYYTGKITQTPSDKNFKSFQAIGKNTSTGDVSKADETYMHSISGDAIVGCFDFFGEGNSAGHAFALDLVTGRQHELSFGDGLSSSAYAVWEAGKDDYVIAGGRTTRISSSSPFTPGSASSNAIGEAVLSDYSLSKNTLSNIKTYQYHYKDALGKDVQADETHFEGIYYCGDGIYETAFTAVSRNQANLPVFGGVAFVKRDSNGVFGDATWYTFQSPSGTTITGNDSVWGNVSVGLQVPSGSTAFSTYVCQISLPA